jgi:DNA-binding MarR family transcriptional regulator
MESKSEKDERLGRLLKGAQQALRNKMDAVLAVSGLTTPQYAALSALERTSQISNADLAKGCFVTNLEDEGLIRKIDHPTHGKIITIELTAKGQKILRTAHQQVNEIERSLLKGFSRQELISMTTCLKRMIKNINSNL